MEWIRTKRNNSIRVIYYNAALFLNNGREINYAIFLWHIC